MPNKITPTDALIGFVGFLTSRKEPLIVGKQYQADKLLVLLNDYVTRVGLGNSSEKFPLNLVENILKTNV